MKTIPTNTRDEIKIVRESEDYSPSKKQAYRDLRETDLARVSVPALLTGGVQYLADAEKLLSSGKADLIGAGRALLKDARWRETA